MTYGTAFHPFFVFFLCRSHWFFEYTRYDGYAWMDRFFIPLQGHIHVASDRIGHTRSIVARGSNLTSDVVHYR